MWSRRISRSSSGEKGIWSIETGEVVEVRGSDETGVVSLII